MDKRSKSKRSGSRRSRSRAQSGSGARHRAGAGRSGSGAVVEFQMTVRSHGGDARARFGPRFGAEPSPGWMGT